MTEVLDVVYNFTVISDVIMTIHRRQNSVKENILIRLATVSVPRRALLGMIDDLYEKQNRRPKYC